MIWFGSKSGSNSTICKETPLCWDQDTFTLLGVRFSTDLSKLIDLNYTPKVQEIRALLAQWSKRNLTPLGRVTVIKTLAISKVNHLFLSLPNPGENIIKQLNTLFFNYLWNGPTDKVTRDVVIKPYHLGGLKMLDVKSFISAMKVSWIRRILNKDTKWLDLHLHACPFMNNFMKFGPNYIYGNIHRINNDFWKDVYKSYADFSNLVKATTSRNS